MNNTNLIETIEDLVAPATRVSLLKGVMTKPLDTGNGNLTASIGKRGELLSLSNYHNNHGYVVVHSHGQFPYDQHYNTPFVRSFRRALAHLDDGLGFGLVPKLPASCFKQYWLNGTLPYVVAPQGDLQVEILSFPDQGNSLYQIFICQNDSDEAKELDLVLGGTMSVNRASYAQLTEGGPILPPTPRNELKVSKQGFTVSNPNLSAHLSATWYGLPHLEVEECLEASSEPIRFQREIQLELPPHAKEVFAVRYTLQANTEKKPVTEQEIVNALRDKLDAIPASLAPLAQENVAYYVVLRNVDYILSCCSVATDPEMTCVMTDHQLLPLAWNRDAYYMVRLLYQYYRQFGAEMSSAQKQKLQSILRSHLNWLFVKAERKDGFWGRSYLTTGMLKDQTFQLDQQCYPLLELWLYHQTFGDLPFVNRLWPAAQDLIDGLLALRTAGTPFLPTEETPADDSVIYPYHFSSHVLLVETLKAMDSMEESLGSASADYLEQAEELTSAIKESMITDYQEQKLFAYLTDGKQNYQLYHDANDLPTVYAPEWGFCLPSDPVWLNTMRFAFSQHNQGGYYSGRYGGLGSIHSPFPWPLGDVQELIFARLTNDGERRERILGKLLTVIQPDGMLPEAIDPHSSAVLSRHWFAWPGATFAYELLKMFQLSLGV